jgi:heme A synthase
MYHFIQKFHSGWAYLALLLLLIAAANAWIGASSKKSFTKKDRTIALIALIVIHIQLLVGLILYFVSPLGKQALGNISDSALRLTALEHPLINVIAIILITIGWSKHKKAATDSAKFKSIAVFYTIGLVLILARIPWNLWF